MIPDIDNITSTKTHQAISTRSTINLQVQDDEEVLLIARRRKLLARNDWLALDSTRPLRMNFPVVGDKDGVGRRKKVKRSSATFPKAAHRRLLTPLFEERLEPAAYLMSGALPPAHDAHIEIKVGTGAFDSQSRPSRRSRSKSNTPRNLSVGPQSTILSHLSEESMLLGADGDTFDADQVKVPEYMQNEREGRGAVVRLSSPCYGVSYDDENEHHGRTYGDDLARIESPELQQLQAWTDDRDICSTANPPLSSANTALISRPAISGSNIWDADNAEHPCDLGHAIRNTPASPLLLATPADEHAIRSDAEKAWRQLMGIPTQSESFTSNKALDSSSQHMTTSETERRAVPYGKQHEASFDYVTTFTPEAGISSLDHIDLGQYRSTSDQPHLAVVPGMPETSAQPPTRSPVDIEDHSDNEALWREFIIGSQDSQSEDEIHSAWQRSRGRTQQSSEQPRSLQISGLGTSDQATKGEAVIASSTPFAVTDVDFENEPDRREDSGEDVSPEPTSTSNSPRNIHVRSTKKLDPRRFKRPRDRHAVATRGGNRVVSRRRSLRRDTETQGQK